MILPFYAQRFAEAPFGTVQFFVGGSGTGTDIPKNIYADLGQTNPLPNPIELDPLGYLPQYFVESGNYYIVVRNRAGNIILTRDQVEAVEPSGGGPGVVGQYFEALLPEASHVSPSNRVPISVLSLSLPAGDWLVEGRATAFITGAMAGNEVVSGLNTSVAIPTDGTEVYGGMQVFSSTNGFQTMTGSKRFSLASTATIHLVGRISFSAGTPGLFGCMHARRLR